MTQCIVLKFGGAAVAQPESFQKIAGIISEKAKLYPRLVVVVSAMPKMTDPLLELAMTVNDQPLKRELDMLVSVGERVSISLLAMALDKVGLKAFSFTGSQSGIITDIEHNQANIVDVRPSRIEACLDSGAIAIVAGFQGVSMQKEITTLGRGGSDTTAVALGVALDADVVEFYKDVPGVYNTDPKKDLKAKHIPSMGYDEALSLVKEENGVLHRRSLMLAQKNLLPLKVMSFLSKGKETWIGEKQQTKSCQRLYELEGKACL